MNSIDRWFPAIPPLYALGMTNTAGSHSKFLGEKGENSVNSQVISRGGEMVLKKFRDRWKGAFAAILGNGKVVTWGDPRVGGDTWICLDKVIFYGFKKPWAKSSPSFTTTIKGEDFCG